MLSIGFTGLIAMATYHYHADWLRRTHVCFVFAYPQSLSNPRNDAHHLLYVRRGLLFYFIDLACFSSSFTKAAV